MPARATDECREPLHGFGQEGHLLRRGVELALAFSSSERSAHIGRSRAGPQTIYSVHT
jgi:hypothetical protein